MLVGSRVASECRVERSWDLCLWGQVRGSVLEGLLSKGEGVNAYVCDV